MAGMIRSMAESGAPMEAINAFRQYRTAPNPKGMAMQDNRELKGERDAIKLQVEKATLGDKIASSHERLSRLKATNPSAIRLSEARAEAAEIDAEIKRTYGNEFAKQKLERQKQIIEAGATALQKDALVTARSMISQYQQKESILNNTFDPKQKALVKQELDAMRPDYEDARTVQSKLGKEQAAKAMRSGTVADAATFLQQAGFVRSATSMKPTAAQIAKAQELAKAAGVSIE